MATRIQAKQDRKARIEAMRAQEGARDRRRRIAWLSGGGVVVAAVVVVVVVVALSKSSGGSGVTTRQEVMLPAVTGATTVESAAITVPNTTGIAGVVAYDTTGSFTGASSTGPANQALPRTHVTGPVQYSVTPPVGGNHNANWMNCGVYDQPVPNERAVHNLEHGAVWITYQPSLSQSEVSELRAFFGRQAVVNPSGQGGSRYIDLTPYPGLPAPIVASSWGFQLRLNSPTDPRLQEFVNKLRVAQKYSPEYGAPCTGGAGTPLQQ
jgi:hypothetical protein